MKRFWCYKVTAFLLLFHTQKLSSKCPTRAATADSSVQCCRNTMLEQSCNAKQSFQLSG